MAPATPTRKAVVSRGADVGVEWDRDALVDFHTDESPAPPNTQEASRCHSNILVPPRT